MGLRERRPRKKGGFELPLEEAISGRQGILDYEIVLGPEPDEVTGRAGLPLVLETWRAMRGPEAVDKHVSIRKRSRGYSESELVEAFLLLLAAGGECLDDFDVLNADRGLMRLVDKEKLPSPDAARQFLLAFHDEEALTRARAELPEDAKALIAPENEALQALWRVERHFVRAVASQGTFDLATVEADATIIESHKREALAHYKKGRGYQPAVAWWAEGDLVLADEFRDGNVPAGMKPLAVVEKAFSALPEGIQRRRLRADSAFYEEKTLKWLSHPDNRIERFTVSADMTEDLRSACQKVAPGDWKGLEERVSEEVFWAEVEFYPGNWPKWAKPFRYLALKFEARQGRLYANGNETKYLAVVSNDWEAQGEELIRWHWQKAGGIEKVHDVVKNELGGGVLPCAELGANAAWFRLCLLTYNVLSAMKTLALPPALKEARPKRLRFKVFSIPARITSHARKLLARMAQKLAEAVELIVARARLRDAAMVLIC
jgi:hypothetical protein